MKLGLVLPSFRLDADTALDTAARAEAAGLDGVFLYDHLFPMGQPERPAFPCLPLLAAVAVETSRMALGALVARVGVVPDAVLVNMHETLSRMAPGRLIAGLGTGDSKSKKENDLFGLPFEPVPGRVAAMGRCARALRATGIPVWMAGMSEPVRALAATDADALNVWGIPPEEVAAIVDAGDVAITWGGAPVSGDLRAHASALADAGATWCIYGPPSSVDWPAMVERIAGARP